MIRSVALQNLRLIWVLIALLNALVTPVALATGSYTTPGSRALADANSTGDSLVAGDNKFLVSSNQKYSGRNFARKFPTEPSVVSGGLFNRNANSTGLLSGLLCSQSEVVSFIMNQDGQLATKNFDLSQAIKISGARDLRCSVDRDRGSWIALNLKNGLGIYFPTAMTAPQNAQQFTLPKIAGQWSHSVSVGDDFVIFSDNGQSAWINLSENTVRQPQLIRSPWSELDPHDTLASSGSLLLRAGQGQVVLTRFERSDGNISWSPVEKINISPCSEAAGCGAWVGADGRWIVSGIWGTYLGLGQKFVRLKLPLVMSDATTPGVAIVADSKKYIVVGDIDADIGNLPAESAFARVTLQLESEQDGIETRGKKVRRSAVWLKGRVSELSEHFVDVAQKPQVLFSYSPHSNLSSAQGDVIVFEGRLPQKLPSHWAAVEPQVEFAPLTMTSEWTPVTRGSTPPSPGRAWWSDSIAIKQATQALKDANITPQPIRIAVIDSGVDATHPALRDVFLMNQNEIPGNGIDDDGNGFIDDTIGYDFVAERPTPQDEFGHGTHVAGLLSNVWSREGILGGAWNARLRILRALDSKGKSNSIDLARAISAAIRGQVDILNCSWGGGPETQILKDAFAATQAANIMVFSSAGNDGLNTDVYPQVPKKFAGVFSIGASTQNQSRARFSNWGAQSVFLFAPGSDITSTLPDGRYGEKSGTSMASPIAASVGALVLGTLRTIHPEWSQRQQIEVTADILCRSSEKNRLAQPSSKCGSLNGLAAIKSTLEGTP